MRLLAIARNKACECVRLFNMYIAFLCANYNNIIINWYWPVADAGFHKGGSIIRSKACVKVLPATPIFN